MNWYWIKTNRLIKRVFSDYVWDIPTVEKKVYLTFDDGPTPEITPWVLDQLKEFNAKATFFCIGDNIQKHPEIFNSILQNGHTIGNHTFNHYNGWKTKTPNYIENVHSCDEAIIQNCYASSQKLGSKFKTQNSKLFRPPYGKIKKSQAKPLLDSGYKIIMWDVLSADFDATVNPEKCLKNVLKNIESGSIIVFHDSVKAFKNLEYALPRTLQFLKDNQYKCEEIV
ncbi:polysaccharide deacetylase family protein [Flavobacterium sp.]|uniref:polysaccharide deacetylase family protein n=1 Tax=Flavobacterium sp. TaxID=239 RepID=UPI00286CF21D|nr:polysaccharide deacetylase family protein [Flavobacterium sp.]